MTSRDVKRRICQRCGEKIGDVDHYSLNGMYWHRGCWITEEPTEFE